MPTAATLTKHRPQPETLNPRQEAFCREWLKDGHGGRAAVAAGYKAENNYSTASGLLRLPKIQAELNRLKAITQDRHQITVDRVLKQAARMAFIDPRSYVDASGAVIPLEKLSDDAAAALQGLEVDATGSGLKHRYKLVDRGAALDRLMRHLGMFKEDNTQAIDAVGQLLASIHTGGSRIEVKR